MNVAEMEIQARADRDEIRRLKAEVARLREEREAQVHAWEVRCLAAEAEVERLRGVISKAVGILEAKETYAFQPEAAIADAHAALRGGGMTGDWAETRAREWLEETLGPVVVQHAYHQFSDAEVSSLAALLREVAAKAQTDWGWRVQRNTLEAVREEVEEIKVSIPGPRHDKSGNQVCDEILARLEKLS